VSASPIELFSRRLRPLVDTDSPSGGTEQELVAEQVGAWLVAAGCRHEWVHEPDYAARSLVLALPGDGGPMVALLGHADTVFAAGTAAARPFRRDGPRCTGPGVADMKGGLVLAAMAIERLAAMPSRPFSELRLLVCADEEVRVRAPAVCRHADGAATALVFECARRNGDLVSARKGALWRTLRLHGRAAHAGADTALGRSAVSALAHEVLRIEALAAGRPDMTAVITTVSGGDAANTVPGEARATIDIRSGVTADLDHAAAELDRPSPYAGVTTAIEDRGTWPPMPPAPALADLALAHARELGLAIGAERSGGVSDGCWTGAAGIPTLDGLGPVGGDDHTDSEWIDLASLEQRIELVVRLVGSICAAAV
jgi:acetylornithine deacetylase/succinyl-diaminopimelate desuccinylase-like protein